VLIKSKVVIWLFSILRVIALSQIIEVFSMHQFLTYCFLVILMLCQIYLSSCEFFSAVCRFIAEDDLSDKSNSAGLFLSIYTCRVIKVLSTCQNRFCLEDTCCQTFKKYDHVIARSFKKKKESERERQKEREREREEHTWFFILTTWEPFNIYEASLGLWENIKHNGLYIHC